MTCCQVSDRCPFGNMFSYFCSKTYIVGSQYSCVSSICPQYILKAKSNLTLFSFEYIYSHSDLKKIKYCNELPTHALTYLMRNDLCNLTHFRVTCTFIRNTQISIFSQNLRETEILNTLLERPSFVQQKIGKTFCRKRLVRFRQRFKVALR